MSIRGVPLALICWVQLSASLEGVYENRESDIRIWLYGSMYFLAEGHPLNLPSPSRHVDFEEGDVVTKRRKVTLVPIEVFHSPNRSSYFELFSGGVYKGYQRALKTKKEQDTFLKELIWRDLQGGPKHVVLISWSHRHPELHFAGVVLRKSPKRPGKQGGRSEPARVRE